MLPVSRIIEESLAVSDTSDRAYAMDFENKKIGGIIEGKAALSQAIRLTLMTERYKYPVFSHSFGVSLEDALEEGYVKAMGKVKNEICSALLCDSRISEVKNFEFERMGTKMKVSFDVVTMYGDDRYETEVE